MPPPDDIVLRYKEHVVYPMHDLECLYCLLTREMCTTIPGECVVPHFALFNTAVHIYIPSAIKSKLLPQHKALLALEFGLTIP